uniref:Uncharacterized protein n=1 Tax=Timema shepardi TaxID=629360 RepID=A0A7R9B2Z2_TIMSH|nr:unnamed protein product [Timema shepardi]
MTLPDQDSNLNFPVIDTLVYHESSALDHAAIEVEDNAQATNFFCNADEQYESSTLDSVATDNQPASVSALSKMPKAQLNRPNINPKRQTWSQEKMAEAEFTLLESAVGLLLLYLLPLSAPNSSFQGQPVALNSNQRSPLPVGLWARCADRPSCVY